MHSLTNLVILLHLLPLPMKILQLISGMFNTLGLLFSHNYLTCNLPSLSYIIAMESFQLSNWYDSIK